MWPGEMSSHRRAGWSSAADPQRGRRSVRSPEGTMAEVPAVAFPRRGGAYRAASSIVQPKPPPAAVTTREQVRSSPVALREARRTWNRDRIGVAADLRCECTRPNCRDLVPAVAEKHRSAAGHFLVAPAHLDGGLVVR